MRKPSEGEKSGKISFLHRSQIEFTTSSEQVKRQSFTRETIKWRQKSGNTYFYADSTPKLLPFPKNTKDEPKHVDPSWLDHELPSILRELLNSESVLHIPKFRFDVSEESAKFNFQLLEENELDLGKLLNPTKKCVTSYGPKFKDTSELEKLLCNHPRWRMLREKLERGVNTQIRIAMKAHG